MSSASAKVRHASPPGAGSDPNPFRQPTDEEVFFQRDQERQEKEQQKQRTQYQRVHEKTTQSALIGSAKKSRALASGLDDTQESSRRRQGYLPELSRTGEPQKEKENMADFIQKKREMGLIRMSLATKRMEIQKLEMEAERAEKKIRQQEEQLEETTQKFEHFLKDNDMKAVEAMKKAEAEAKGKNEKAAEIKKLTAHNAAVMAEKQKNEEHLLACFRYKQDLDKLTPDSWFRDVLINIRVQDRKDQLTQQFELELEEAAQEQTEGAEIDTDELKKSHEERVEKEVAQYREKVTEEVVSMQNYEEDRRRQAPGFEVEPEKTVKGQLDEMFEMSNDADKVPMFFTEPDKILNIFVEIEENNLFLIQNCQEIEQAFEELKTKFEDSRIKMERQVTQLKSQIDIEKQKIAVEKAKLDMLLQRRSQSEDYQGQEELREKIENTVMAIYKEWLGDDYVSKTTLMLMTEIETKLEELKLYIDENPGVPAETVSILMKQRDKMRRDFQRQRKREEERAKQKKRGDQVLQRAFQSVKKRVGKPVMWRSKPEEKKKQQKEEQQQEDDEDEEYFR